jgi:hypothetical protein
MRLSLVAAAYAAAMSTAVPAHAGGEWPDGPNKLGHNHLEPYRNTDPESLFCCGIATLKIKFKVEHSHERYPEDRWHAWLKDERCAGWQSEERLPPIS